MDLSDHLKNCRCYSAVQTTHSLLPQQQAAVYAFYDAIKLKGDQAVNDIDTLATTRARSISLDLSPLPKAVTIKLRGTPVRFKKKGKAYVEAIPSANRDTFCNALHFLSIMNEPLYIGETEDVKARFMSHHDRGFIYRMRAEGRPPEDFVFFYYAIPHDLHKAIETVLIHMISPSGNTTGSLIPTP